MSPYAAALFVLALAAPAVAQEQAPPAPVAEEAQDEEETAAPRHHIQVLEHPYEISSFYRSSQRESGSDFGYGTSEEAPSSRYPIAGFYRAGASGRYSQFWTTGYGSGYGYGSNGYGNTRIRGRGLIGASRPRALGLNGDLYLFAPTFLAPVGPLTGVFFER